MGEDSNKYMTMEETMKALGLSRASIDLRAREGKLKRFQRGKNVLFLRSQVEDLLTPKPKPPRKKKL